MLDRVAIWHRLIGLELPILMTLFVNALFGVNISDLLWQKYRPIQTSASQPVFLFGIIRNVRVSLVIR